MSDKVELLLAKVEQLIERMEKIKNENATLKERNQSLMLEINSLKKKYDQVRVGDSDRDDQFKTRLTGILERLDELEEMVG